MTGMDFIYIAIQTSYKAISIDIHTEKERKKNMEMGSHLILMIRNTCKFL